MATAEALPPDASTAITGLGLNYIGGSYWAAWSGEVVTNNSTVTALEFDSPGVPLDFLISWATDFAQIGSGHEYRLVVELNDQTVFRFGSKNEAARASADWDPIYLIIPPRSKVKLTVFCETSTNIAWTINITGKEL